MKKKKCEHGTPQDAGHYCLYCHTEKNGYLDLEEMKELRVIIARLLTYLDGDWKIWLPYEDKQSKKMLNKILSKFRQHHI